jgi:hypothetical protein
MLNNNSLGRVELHRADTVPSEHSEKSYEALSERAPSSGRVILHEYIIGWRCVHPFADCYSQNVNYFSPLLFGFVQVVILTVVGESVNVERRRRPWYFFVVWGRVDLKDINAAAASLQRGNCGRQVSVPSCSVSQDVTCWQPFQIQWCAWAGEEMVIFSRACAILLAVRKRKKESER